MTERDGDVFVYQGLITITAEKKRLVACVTATASPKTFSSLDTFLDSQECEARVHPAFKRCNVIVYGKLVHITPEGMVGRVVEKERVFQHCRRWTLLELVRDGMQMLKEHRVKMPE